MLNKACLTILFYFGLTSVQSQPWLGPHETRDKSSKYISKEKLNLPTSKGKLKNIQQVQGFVSVQVNTNINGLNTIGDAANEPSIAVNPLKPNQIAIGWRQFNTVTSNFRQAGKSYSDDGGLTWNYQQVFEPGVFRSDPVLNSNADGHFYYHSLKVDVANNGNLSNFFIDQWKSYDGGATWVEKTFAYGGDKSWFAIDKTTGKGRGNIYSAWNISGNSYAPNTFNYLIDGETSFSMPVEIFPNPIFGTLDVGADGSLYIVGLDGGLFHLGSFYLIKAASSNLFTPYFHQTTPVDLGGQIRIGGVVNSLGLDGQLYVKLDKSNRNSKNNVYVLASIEPTGLDPLDVHFARSTDGGSTFSQYKRINTDLTTDWQWFGTMSVAPNGRIDIIWNDTRNDDGSDNVKDHTSRLFYTYSYDAGITFAKEQAVGPRYNHLKGYPRQSKMGDYIDMESDNLGAHIAYTATYNGEQDVYYMHAKPSAVEENPDFPSIMTNNAWSVTGAPSQGILSSTLINNGNPENPLLTFEAIFTAKPDGTPIWLVATGEVPKFGDSFSIPVYMPTGDLSENGQALLAIGIMTKNRLRDEEGELIDNKIEYVFDMTDDVKVQLLESLGAQFDETFFSNNPFHSIQKTLTFNSLLPRAQARKDLCNINAQMLVSQGEKNEGRLQYTYLRDGILELFAADFTYKKTITDGVAILDLDANGLATPIWEVIQSDASGVMVDNSVINSVYKPNGGLGFFETGNTTGVTEIGTEQVVVNGSQLITTKSNTVVETMNVLASNAYCGEIQ